MHRRSPHHRARGRQCAVTACRATQVPV